MQADMADIVGIQGLLGSGSIWYNILGIIVYAVIVMVLLSVFGYTFGWIERKIIARAQYRHGPTYVGKYGFLQNMADLIKLLSKREIRLAQGDNFMVRISVPLMLSLSVFILLLLPFSQSLQATNLGLGLLLVFVTIAFFPMFVFLTGFSTGNKFGDISAQRSVLMLLSYELPMIIVIVTIALATGSYNIQGIVAAQANRWFALVMPLGFIVMFVAMLAEFERPPFDLREADSELIAGRLTDISAPYYALVLFLEYTRMFLGSMIISLLFLGGWLGPSFLPGIAWMLIKATLVALFVIVIRATMFRMRIDRVLHLGWLVLIPLSLINLLITYIVLLWIL
ncbi:MAG: NADH-quinone oxidoreductase subunit H [Candidatus Micrarchaeota archaeon]|nr:NADH-quinone oxidoreductase subunit H [Candidatus Micrarchaeota archaeon]